MARRSWVYIDGVAYEKGVDIIPERNADGATFIPDIEPFRSSVDGTMITSRASLREHNKRNNVVQTAELSGLPPQLANPEYTFSKQQVQERREQIAHAYDKFRSKR